ncbi:MAG: Peptidase and in, kexin, sedolisin [Paenibacillaceae bacterium]|jgi:subtilisin|nr:Peptidase and in, kexin, sedolisin [Paenibacillaceae bacterium]
MADFSRFIECLQEELAGETQAEQRQIIRFRNPLMFRRCLRKIRQMCKKETVRLIQPLSMIHAISCPLSFRSSRGIAATSTFSFVHSVEVDTKMNIHAPRSAAKSGEAPRIPWGVKRIQAPQAWAYSTGDQIGIGVIDTGIDYSHPDLRGAIGKGINLIHHNMPPVDDNGHGTHIAGTIAAASKSGITGVAPQAVIHPVKSFDKNGSAFVSDIIAGMEWCVQNKIPIINMSFGMKRYSKSLEDTVRNVARAGISIVASSGNDGFRSKVDYPAGFRQTISVGAVNERNKIAPFSNRGKLIDIYAPGNRIYSTWLYGRYHEMSGTSMATSHVSGVVALMLARRPGLTPMQIKQILRRHAIRTSGGMSGKKPAKVIKVVNARRALKSVTR